MPFQSEKQRRYLWANEPEIARDWTDTYGSGIARALGGRIQYQRGGPGPGGQGARGQATQNPGRSGPSGPPGGGDRQMTYTAPVNRHTGPTTQEALATGQKKKEMRDLLARQQAEKDYTRQGVMKPGPQLGRTGGMKNFLGNWASSIGGAQLGGGLGSLLLGPWGMLLGSIFGQGVGRRSWKASQTPQKETARDILMPEFMRNFFDKRINEQGRGITGTDASNEFAKAKRSMTQVGLDKFRPMSDAQVQKYGQLSTQNINRGVYDPYGIRTPSGAFSYDMNYQPNKVKPRGDDSVSSSAISLADMSREDFDKLASERGIEGLDLIQSKYKGQEYLDDLSQIGEGADYLVPTREELDAGINLGDLTGDVWTGGKGLQEMKPSEYENYIGNRRR